MSKLYYNYHQTTNEYLAPAQEADQSPEEPGVFHKPAFSTFKEPPRTNENQAAVFSNGAWVILPDYRGKSIYSKINGQPIEIKQLGLAPNTVNQTLIPMPDPTFSWNEKADNWVQDPAKVEAIFSNVKNRAYDQIEGYHTNSLTKLYGNYTDTERSTWAMKLRIANLVISGEVLDDSAKAFFKASDQTTEDKQKQWSELVSLRNSQYSFAVGMADRHRTQARAIAKASTNATFLKSDLDKFFIECDKEIDKFLS